MSERNEFDDLARRKLEEREFRFLEADWLEAQRLIAQQRSSGTWRIWLVAGMGVVLVGASVWSITGDRSIVQESPTVAGISKEAKGSTLKPHATPPEEQPEIVPDPSGTATRSEASAQRSSHPRAESSSGSVPKVEAAQASVQHEQVTAPYRQQRPERNATLKARTTSAIAEPVIHEAPQDPSSASAESSAAFEAAFATTTTLAEPITDPIAGTSSPVIMEPEALNENSPTGSEQPLLPPSASSMTVSETGISTGASANIATIDPRDTTTVDPQYTATRPNSTKTFTADTSATPTAASEPSKEPSAVRVQASATTAMALPPPPPLITPGSPWEIGVVLGGLLSRSTYTGGNSADWIDGQTGRWSPAFGGEVMHMGRNFGMGSGLHYSTYQEDLHIAERSLTTTVIQDSNYFESFDTTILYVLGNVIIDGEQYYVTESRDTTIDVLVLGTTSSSTTRKLIDARDVSNRVSYVEVPLLLDAHVVQGAWAIGLRGGPTVGLLNGRRGAIPNASFDGYTDFATEQFRSPVLGLTARAYLRYRFVNGWSVGVEPTWRGHFGNALNSGDLTRRSSAVGAMISVSYRLR